MATNIKTTYANIVFPTTIVGAFTTSDYVEGGFEEYTSAIKVGNINGRTTQTVNSVYAYRTPLDSDKLEGNLSTNAGTAVLKPNNISTVSSLQVSMNNNLPNQISVVTDGQDIATSVDKTPRSYWTIS